MDPATAMLIGGGLSAGGNILGSLFGGSSDSGDLEEAIYAGIAEQRRQYDETVKRFQPYYEAGTGALPYMTDIAYNLETSPLYTWRLKEAQEANDKALAARGLYNSGAGLQLQSDTVNQLSAEESENKWNRLNTLAGYGSSAAANTASAGASSANTISNLYSTLGTAQNQASIADASQRSSLYSGLGALGAGTLTGYGQSLAYQNTLKQLAGQNANNGSWYSLWGYG
jgi:hypothetical protein